MCKTQLFRLFQEWNGLHVVVGPGLEPAAGLLDEEEEGEAGRRLKNPEAVRGKLSGAVQVVVDLPQPRHGSHSGRDRVDAVFLDFYYVRN